MATTIPVTKISKPFFNEKPPNKHFLKTENSYAAVFDDSNINLLQIKEVENMTISFIWCARLIFRLNQCSPLVLQNDIIDFRGYILQNPMQVSSSYSCCSLQWRHNGCYGITNHQPRDCLLNRLLRRRSKKTSKLRFTGLCEGNSPLTREFPAQRASYAEVSIWWRHHIYLKWSLKSFALHDVYNQ